MEIDRSRFKQYSVDEQMIPYLGRLPGIKCTVKNKPRPVGVKNMVIATSDTDQKGLIKEGPRRYLHMLEVSEHNLL